MEVELVFEQPHSGIEKEYRTWNADTVQFNTGWAALGSGIWALMARLKEKFPEKSFNLDESSNRSELYEALDDRRYRYERNPWADEERESIKRSVLFTVQPYKSNYTRRRVHKRR